MKEDIVISGLRDIPGYNGKYQANPIGQIIRLYGNGKMRLMRQYLHHNKFVVKLSVDGVQKEVPAATAILLTFRGPCLDGMVPHHKNLIKSDNRIDNLEYITRLNLGVKTGYRSRSQSVLKIKENGEVDEVYRSAREAARRNHMSYQTVMDRCNGKVKKPFALDGYTYMWEDGRTGRPRKDRQ